MKQIHITKNEKNLSLPISQSAAKVLQNLKASLGMDAIDIIELECKWYTRSGRIYTFPENFYKKVIRFTQSDFTNVIITL